MGGLIVEYSIYPTRAMDKDTARFLEGLEQLADQRGIDLTRDLKHTDQIDQKMTRKGPTHGRNK